jgi:hypothetical protein
MPPLPGSGLAVALVITLIGLLAGAALFTTNRERRSTAMDILRMLLRFRATSSGSERLPGEDTTSVDNPVPNADIEDATVGSPARPPGAHRLLDQSDHGDDDTP